MSLPGRSRTIVVEPVRVPDRRTAPAAPPRREPPPAPRKRPREPARA